MKSWWLSLDDVNSQPPALFKGETMRTATIIEEKIMAHIVCQCPHCPAVNSLKWNNGVMIEQEKCSTCGEQFIVSREQ